MTNKGGLGHLKRLPSPWFWPIHRKEFTWSTKPNPGAHGLSECLPLQLILRDALAVAKTRKEVTTILSLGRVKVDGRVRREKNYPVGLMDVVELLEADISYRVLPIPGKGLTPIKITKEEAKFKLSKILRKKTASTNGTQYGTHDGRNLLVSTKETGETPVYSTNDTLRISIPSQRVLTQFKFEKGNVALVIAGRNLGKNGKIAELQPGTATRPAMVTVEDSTGSKFDTMADYAFIVGSDKPVIKLEAA